MTVPSTSKESFRGTIFTTLNVTHLKRQYINKNSDDISVILRTERE